MIEGDRVRITRGAWIGCTGTIVAVFERKNRAVFWDSRSSKYRLRDNTETFYRVEFDSGMGLYTDPSFEYSVPIDFLERE